MNLIELYKERLIQLGDFGQPGRSQTVLSNLKERFEPVPFSDLDKVMLAYSGFIAGIALVSLTPHTSTNLQVVLGSLAFWTGAACYLYKRRKLAASLPTGAPRQ